LVPACGDLEALLDERGEAARAAKHMGLGSVYEDLRSLELTRRLLHEMPVAILPRDNRRMVEEATHPDRLSSLSGERWDKHAQTVDGATLARRLAAYYTAATFREPFGAVTFNELNEKARTRLGLDTLRLPVPGAPPSPFGQALEEMTIPGHLISSAVRDAAVTDVEASKDGMRFRVGPDHFIYSRFGLEKEKVA
jgi:CRISPR-associated endonuclease/helicase Cas3